MKTTLICKTILVVSLLALLLVKAAHADLWLYQGAPREYQPEQAAWCVAKGMQPVNIVTNSVITTNTIPANAEVQLRYASAWDLVSTAYKYGATNEVKLANLYVMEAWRNAATDDVERAGIIADAARSSEIENNLTRNLGQWKAALMDNGQEHVLITTNTVVSYVPRELNPPPPLDPQPEQP